MNQDDRSLCSTCDDFPDYYRMYQSVMKQTQVPNEEIALLQSEIREQEKEMEWSKSENESLKQEVGYLKRALLERTETIMKLELEKQKIRTTIQN